jgi:NTP pyrophosphatase (non-canonical NTP hydrolase)
MNLCDTCQSDCNPYAKVLQCENHRERLPNVYAPVKPKPVITPRAEIQFFAERMECKLQLNDHKPHWRNLGLDYLMCRLKDEVAELEDAIASGGTRNQRADEAADVANFAMMIADIFTLPCQRTEREGK